jgi:hypothetical protein
VRGAKRELGELRGEEESERNVVGEEAAGGVLAKAGLTEEGEEVAGGAEVVEGREGVGIGAESGFLGGEVEKPW